MITGRGQEVGGQGERERGRRKFRSWGKGIYREKEERSWGLKRAYIQITCKVTYTRPIIIYMYTTYRTKSVDSVK